MCEDTLVGLANTGIPKPSDNTTLLVGILASAADGPAFTLPAGGRRRSPAAMMTGPGVRNDGERAPPGSSARAGASVTGTLGDGERAPPGGSAGAGA